MKIQLAMIALGVVSSACGAATGGGAGGGNGGGNVSQYPGSVHLKLTLKYSTLTNDSAGNLLIDQRWAGTFEGNSSASRISGVNEVYDFDNSLDTVTGASHYKKDCAGAGPCSEFTETIDGLQSSALSLTVGPTSFNASTGALVGPFFGFLTDQTSFGAGIRAMAGTTQVSFTGQIPAQLDSQCPADPNVSSSGVIALDGDVFSGYAIGQTYTCTVGNSTSKYENSVQITAL